MNDKAQSTPILSCAEDDETRVQDSKITTMELQTIASNDLQKKLCHEKGEGYPSHSLSERTFDNGFDTIPEENEDFLKSDFAHSDAIPVLVDDNGTLFDSEASDLEAEEASHEIVYSAMTQLVQQETNPNNLRGKTEVDVENSIYLSSHQHKGFVTSKDSSEVAAPGLKRALLEERKYITFIRFESFSSDADSRSSCPVNISLISSA
ncbi:hypothetical protein GE061_013322 [Apolygus lucorum]|uniref:Uncharacterized protein n=1 Tax=Apolygus lucorum TaxID=248454 RepID=A0A8S9XNP2_APOLU|nr:hypothetical protein GE061_013322 [Apolygus lucorum]